MSFVSIDDTKGSREIKSSFLDQIAKKMLLKVLSGITIGRIVVQEGDQIHEFGDNAQQAEVVAHVFIHHSSAYKDILFGGSVGAGESYMLGSWDSSNLVDVIRVMAANIDLTNKIESSKSTFSRLSAKFFHLLNANTASGSRKNISAHYDLGNDFFSLFLDPTMMYSSAVFPSTTSSLEDASLHKMDIICKKLDLSPQDHLIEIGTGWGGMAIYAAKNYGCKVTTTTISQEQYDYASDAVEREGLGDKITLLLKDYRDLDGHYDKLVSVEMIEAVGHAYYDNYFAKCSSLLKPNGKMLIQSITIADQRYHFAKDNVDFIQRYIFPGGCLPSNEVIAKCTANNTDLKIVDLHDIGHDYALTLNTWRQRFHGQLDQVKAMGFDDVFCRMWEYYLCYCEGAFIEKSISTVQIVFFKPRANSAYQYR
jgi:cyclopropane-fatty-acyl-phospholipid synthase